MHTFGELPDVITEWQQQRNIVERDCLNFDVIETRTPVCATVVVVVVVVAAAVVVLVFVISIV